MDEIKIKTNKKADSKLNWYQTTAQTYKHDFIVPFQLKPGVQKRLLAFYCIYLKQPVPK